MESIMWLAQLKVGDSIIVIEVSNGNTNIFQGEITDVSTYGDITLNDAFGIDWLNNPKEQFVVRTSRASEYTGKHR